MFTPSFGCFAALALVCLSFTSCERGPDTSEATVSWPELVAFDELVYRAEGLAKVKDREGLMGSREAMVEAGKKVSSVTMPANVADSARVEQLLGDLSGLVDGLDQSEMSDEKLFSLVEGLHPVVEAMIGAAGMPHLHASEGPHDGFLHPLFAAGGKQIGTGEIKLHDDAGDVEIWLTQGGRGGDPWDLPVATILTMEFPGLGKSITLAVRDAETNADESGAATVRDGATNYFVFPGGTGADPEWLMGEEFAAKAILRFEGAATDEFVLRPHVHRDGEGE